jgi:alkenylglycerophosphocholine/alkenylglycerophosphoethanolamine hydrolase
MGKFACPSFLFCPPPKNHRPAVQSTLAKLLLALPLAISLFFFGVLLPSWELMIAAKTLPALLLAAAVHWGMPRNPYGSRIALALVFCAAGDLLLELGETGFLAGMGAFFIGHLLFIVAISLRERRMFWPILALFSLWMGTLSAFLLDGLGELTVPVIMYGTVITCLLWRSGAYFLATEAKYPPANWAFVGAVFFAFSDSLIALNKFYHQDSIPFVQYPIMFFYWGSLACFALSAAADARSAQS